jgi:hypothetical protein
MIAPDGVRCHLRNGALVMALEPPADRLALRGQTVVAGLALATALVCHDQLALACALGALGIALFARALRLALSRERIEISCDDVVVRSWAFGSPTVRRACLTRVGVFKPDVFGVSAGGVRVASALQLDRPTRRWIADRLNQHLGALRGWR